MNDIDVNTEAVRWHQQSGYQYWMKHLMTTVIRSCSSDWFPSTQVPY